MKRSSILASAAALSLLVVTIQACSGEDGEEDQGQGNLQGQGGQVGGVGGAAPAVGGNAGAPPAGVGGTSPGLEGQGGTPGVAGQGGAATSPATQGGSGGAPPAQGGAAGAPPAQGGTGGAPTGAPPACVEPPSPSNGISCTVTCSDPCSIHQLGTRVCDCPGEEACDEGQTAPCYDCGTCVFINPNDPLITVPAGPLPDCTADDGVLEDAETCTENDRCLSIRVNGSGVRNRFCGCRANSWDCDSKPSNFP